MTKRRYTIDDCIKIAKSKNGTCLSKKYINVKEKLKWKCANNHVWFAKLADILYKKSWCQRCWLDRVGDTRRLSIKDARLLSKKHKGRCLSKKYYTSKEKLQWQCEHGHIFSATYSDIKNKNSWCSVCSMEKSKKRIISYNNKLQKKIINGLENIANQRGGHLVSKKCEYKNAKSKLKWKCSKGHEFLSSYQQVGNQDQWCPYCSKYKTQFRLRDILKKIFIGYNIFDNYRGFKWLSTGGTGVQEIDIYIPKLKIAIEYNGVQHFRPVCFGNISKARAMENYKKQIKLDKMKYNKIKKHKKDIKHMIYFDYKERDKFSVKYVKNKMISCGIIYKWR